VHRTAIYIANRSAHDLIDNRWLRPNPSRDDGGVPYTVRRIHADEWPTLRAVRLTALGDSPLAFETTLAQASAYDDDEWQARTTRHATADDSSMFLAFDPAGDAVGMMGAEVAKNDHERVYVFGVWVAPEHRGGPAAALLIEAIAAWARDGLGARELILEVNETNARATAFYLRRGFVATGQSRPYPNDPTLAELEFVRPLR